MTLTDNIARLDQAVDGFMVPIFRMEDPSTGRMLNGLGPDDYQRVVQGYACPDCLAKFTMYLAACPVCNWTRNIDNDVQRAPGYWQQHLEDRADPDYGVTPTPTQDMIEQALKDIHNDPEIEQIPLRKLKKTRQPKGEK